MKKLFLLLICVFASVGRAAVVENLYDVTVPVAEQSQRELKRATAEGLATVLIRVSGRQDIRSNPVVAGALADARRYLSQYQYETVKREPERDEPDAPERETMLHLIFIGSQVTQLLQEAQLPVWSSNRPRVLVWLVVDDATGRHFATPDSNPKLVESLEKHAQRRGLVLTYPLLDLQDSINLTPRQLWTLDPEAIERAMERYHVDHFLVGRLSTLSSGSWLGSWYFSTTGQEFYLDAREPEAEAVARQPLDMVADRLAAKYAIVPSGEGNYSAFVHIRGIGSFSQYAEAMTYLEKNAAIEHANMVWLSGDAVIVDLVLKGSLAKAEQFFALDNRLVAVDPPAEPPRVGVPPRESAAPEKDAVSDADKGESAAEEDTDEQKPAVQPRSGPGGRLSGVGRAVVEAVGVDKAQEPAPFINIQGYYRWQGY